MLDAPGLYDQSRGLDDGQNNNFIVDTASPLAAGLPNPIVGAYASHAHLAGYPANAHVSS